jgi:hypothetical protein
MHWTIKAVRTTSAGSKCEIQSSFLHRKLGIYQRIYDGL